MLPVPPVLRQRAVLEAIVERAAEERLGWKLAELKDGARALLRRDAGAR